MPRKIDGDLPQNPFMTMGRIPILRKNDEKRSVSINNLVSGEEVILNPETYGINRSYYVDAQSSYKTYRFKQGDLPTLSRVALLFICTIPHKLSWNQDLINISTIKYSQEFNVSSVSITTALNELIDSNYLLRYKKGYYWINPFAFFYGDRIKKYSNKLIPVNEN